LRIFQKDSFIKEKPEIENFKKENSRIENSSVKTSKKDNFLDFPPPPPELSFTEDSPKLKSHQKNPPKNSETMSNSSYKRVNLSKVDIAKVQSYGPGLSVVTTFQQTEFFVDLNESGPGSLQLSMMGPSDAGIRMNQDIGNKYRVSYFPKEPGNYEINVKFTDKHIPGSPFKIKCVGSGIKDQMNRQKNQEFR
jgi:filamin